MVHYQSDINLAESSNHEAKAPRFNLRTFLIFDFPYVAMLLLALFGVAYTSVAQMAMTSYWMVLVPLFGIIIVAAHWRDIENPQGHWRLIRTQALHWAAVMFATYLVFVADVKHMMNADASALMILALLALGTFTAGVHADSWRVCLVGIMLALGVPAIAWLEQSTLLILLAAIVLGAFTVFLFMHTSGDGKNHATPAQS